MTAYRVEYRVPGNPNVQSSVFKTELDYWHAREEFICTHFCRIITCLEFTTSSFELIVETVGASGKPPSTDRTSGGSAPYDPQLIGNDPQLIGNDPQLIGNDPQLIGP